MDKETYYYYIASSEEQVKAREKFARQLCDIDNIEPIDDFNLAHFILVDVETPPSDWLRFAGGTQDPPLIRRTIFVEFGICEDHQTYINGYDIRRCIKSCYKYPPSITANKEILAEAIDKIIYDLKNPDTTFKDITTQLALANQKKPRSPMVFVSYSHKDTAIKDQVITLLKALRNNGKIDFWADQYIEVGESWMPEILNALENSQVALLLVTTDFLASDFITRIEVKRILEKRLRKGLSVFPILVKNCPWQAIDWLKEMQIFTKNGKAFWDDNDKISSDDLTAISLEINKLVTGLTGLP